jgi:hypothetical protein
VFFFKDGKETYQSEPITFTVPNKKDEHNTEIINVYEEPDTPDDKQG